MTDLLKPRMIYAWSNPMDLRKGFFGLFKVTRQALGREPMPGEFFLFMNRQRDRCKVLFHDGTGLLILMKRLDNGLFPELWRSDGRSVELTPKQLSLFLGGQPTGPQQIGWPRRVTVANRWRRRFRDIHVAESSRRLGE